MTDNRAPIIALAVIPFEWAIPFVPWVALLAILPQYLVLFAFSIYARRRASEFAKVKPLLNAIVVTKIGVILMNVTWGPGLAGWDKFYMITGLVMFSITTLVAVSIARKLAPES